MALNDTMMLAMNAFSNDTNGTSTPTSHGRSQSSFYISLTFLYIPGLITNALALRLILRDIRFINIPTNMLLFSLCLTDFVSIINSLTWHTIRRLVPTLNMNIALCGVKSFFGPFFPMFSGLVSALIAIDRFLSFLFPYFYINRISCKVWSVVTACMAVILGLLGVLPYVGLGDFWFEGRSRGKMTYICSALSSHKEPMKNAFIFIYVFLGIAVMGIIAVCNGAVIVTMFKMKKRVPVVQGGEQADRKRKTLELEFAKMVLVLTCTFLVCWTPYHISVLYKAFNLKMALEVVGYIHLLAGVNYTIDPLIYLISRRSFRTYMISAFRKCLNCCKTPEKQTNENNTQSPKPSSDANTERY